MDKLVVAGLGGIDGEYDCDIAGMLSLGTPDSLTNGEGRQIKLMSGVRAGELEEAIIAGDSDVLVALAAVILRRHRVRFDEKTLWDAPMGSALDLRMDEPEEDEDNVPPGIAPPEKASDELEPSGGASSSRQSDGLQESHPSSTGRPDSAISVVSDLET